MTTTVAEDGCIDDLKWLLFDRLQEVGRNIPIRHFSLMSQRATPFDMPLWAFQPNQII